MVHVQGNYHNGGVYWIVYSISFWLLFSYMIPISLFVTMEIVKAFQARSPQPPVSAIKAACQDSHVRLAVFAMCFCQHLPLSSLVFTWMTSSFGVRCKAVATHDEHVQDSVCCHARATPNATLSTARRIGISTTCQAFQRCRLQC